MYAHSCDSPTRIRNELIITIERSRVLLSVALQCKTINRLAMSLFVAFVIIVTNNCRYVDSVTVIYMLIYTVSVYQISFPGKIIDSLLYRYLYVDNNNNNNNKRTIFSLYHLSYREVIVHHLSR